VSDSPTVAKWELALRLGNRRRQLGLDQKDVARLIGTSLAYWSFVEKERKTISAQKLELASAALEFDDAERERLAHLRALSVKPAWWSEYHDLFQSDDRLWLIGMEDGAVATRIFEGRMVPSILQTEDCYQARVMANPTVSPARVSHLVAVHKRRRDRLSGEGRLGVDAVISEATLASQAVGVDAQRAQLDHLVQLVDSEDHDVTIRVAPFSASTGGAGELSNITVLDFAGSDLPSVAYHEALVLSQRVTDPATVDLMDLAHRIGVENSLGHEDSVAMIKHYYSKLR